jgi:hypothetical protein
MQEKLGVMPHIADVAVHPRLSHCQQNGPGVMTKHPGPYPSPPRVLSKVGVGRVRMLYDAKPAAAPTTAYPIIGASMGANQTRECEVDCLHLSLNRSPGEKPTDERRAKRFRRSAWTLRRRPFYATMTQDPRAFAHDREPDRSLAAGPPALR